MVASLLNIRFNQNQSEKITHNARLRGIKPDDYVRGLIDREEREITCAEFDREVTRILRRKKSVAK